MTSCHDSNKQPKGAEQKSSRPTISSGHLFSLRESEPKGRHQVKRPTMPFAGASAKGASTIEILQLLTNVALAVIGAIAICIYVGQLKVFENQFAEMHEQTGLLSQQAHQAAQDALAAGQQAQSQITIAQQQAKAAQDGVVAIRRQMRQDQRAWLVVTYGPFNMAANQPLSIPITITNIGKTAIKYRANMVVKRLQNTEQTGRSLSFDYNFPHLRDSAGSIPTEPYHVSVSEAYGVTAQGDGLPRQLSQLELDRLQSGQDFAVVYLELTYQDIFGVEHVTRGCRFTVGPLSSGSYARKCSDYNSMDNN